MKLGGYIILPEYSDPIVRQLTGVTIELDEKLIGALVSKKIGPTLTIPEVSKKPKEVVKEGFDEIIRKVNQLAEDKVMTKQDVLEMLGVTEKKMNKLIVLKLREVEQKQDVEKDVFDIKDFELEEEFYALSTYHFAGLKEDGLTLEDIKKDVLNLNYGDGIIKITDYYTGMEILKGYTDKNANNKRDDDEEAEDYEKLETYCMKDESGEEKKAGCPNRLGANRVFTFTYNDKNYELTIEKLVEKATQAVSTVERTFKRPEINTVLLFIEKIVPGVHKDLKKKINDQLVWDSTFMAYYNFYEENPDTVKLIVGDKAIVPSEQIKKDIKKEMGNILSWPEIFREEFKVYIGDDKANNEEAGELLYLIKGKLGELPKGLEKYQDILDVYYQRKVLVVVDSKRVSFDSVIELNLLEDNEIKVHKHDVGATVEINNFAIEDVEPVQLFASLEDPYGDNELEVNDKRATDVRFKKPENPKEWFGIAQKLFENKDMELLKEKVEEPITEPEEQQEEMPVEEELPEPEETIIEAPSELLDLDEPTGEVIE